MSLQKIREAVQAAEGNARQMGEVVLMIAQADEHAAEVIAADLDNPEMSFDKCFAALRAYASKHQKGGFWGCMCNRFDPENPVIQVVADFYKVPLEGVQSACDILRPKLEQAEKERDEAKAKIEDLQEQLDAIEDKPAEVRELTEEELEEIRSKVREENAEAARAAEERARAAEEKLDKVKNPAAHKVNFLFGEVRGLVERLEQALAELQQSDEAAREKFAKVIADWLCKEGDRLA